MGYVPLENMVDKSCMSVYKLVIIAARRALEIVEGQPKLVDADPSVKPSTVALYEISAGKVSCKIAKAAK